MKKYLFIPFAMWCSLSYASDDLSNAMQNVHTKCITDFGNKVEILNEKINDLIGITNLAGITSGATVLMKLIPKFIQKLNYRTDENEHMEIVFNNVRTFGASASTITNVAGAITSAQTRIDEDLKNLIAECKIAVNNLSHSRMQARLSGAPDSEIQKADQIIKGCENIGTVNINLINTKANNATISSGIGTATSLAGAITSALSNTKKVREGDDKKEKGLNIAANSLMIASSASSILANSYSTSQQKELSKLDENLVSCIEAFENKTSK